MKILWNTLGEIKYNKPKPCVSYKIRPCCAGIKLCKGGYNKRKSWHEQVIAYNCLNCGQDLVDEETLERFEEPEEIKQMDLFISSL